MGCPRSREPAPRRAAHLDLRGAVKAQALAASSDVRSEGALTGAPEVSSRLLTPLNRRSPLRLLVSLPNAT
jgi:hypothetical protein